MICMLFSEVRVTAVADTPVLLLREQTGVRHLAVWITAAGGNAILSALEDGDESFPTTHDLMIESLAIVDAVIESVAITAMVDGVYRAHLVIDGSVVAARVSDAVALALRCGAPILAAEDLVEAVGIGGPVTGEPLADGPAVPDEQVEQFRAFLDTINPEDFGPHPDKP